MESTFVSSIGAYVSRFEQDVARYCKAQKGVALVNGTSALHTALNVVGVQSGDEVITQSLTFVATANSIILNNLKPELVDIDLTTYTIDVNKLEHKLKKDNKIKAVIAVDYAGNICDWKSLNFLARKYNIKLINDNCHAIGSMYNDSIKYASQFADVVTQSYHPVKAITTAEGGSILTNNKKIYENISLLKNNGIIRNKNLSKKFGAWFYSIKKLGYNYRLSDIQCALGISQLKRLNQFILARRKIAKIYDKAFSNIDKISIEVNL